MMVFISLFQSAENGYSVKFRWLVDHNGLEPPLKSLILFKVFLIFIERRCSDGSQLAACQGWFQNVGRIHGTLASACPDERVNFVDEEDYIAFGLGYLLYNALQAFLELAFIFRAGQQRTHIERINLFVLQIVGHVAAYNSSGQSFDDSCFSGSGFANQYGIILGSARQNLQNSSNLFIAPNHRVEFAGAGIFNQITSKL